ncbi:MAG: cupin domain-containing protein [Anaerosomatales bacterium]|nr:cupin domain-containing protein [Anaerosomatales bacterium]MDT8434580.1 cupin domain-containing protein [Anaerosomatales bacterium]
MTENTGIGGKLTTLRESLGLSPAELAERSGCEVAVIEQLESGRIAPSLAPLIKLTRALGVRLGTLLDDEPNVGPVIVRAGEESAVERTHDLETGVGAGTLDFRSLAQGKTARHMEPFVITVNPARDRSLSTHEGEEFIYVLGGEIEIEYGNATHRLGAGDTIYYDSIVPHQVRAAGASVARILAVVYAPV